MIQSLKRRKHPAINIGANPTNAQLQRVAYQIIEGKPVTNEELRGLIQTLAQNINVGGDILRVSNSAEGDTGAFTIKTAREVHTLTLAAQSSTTTLLIPAGAMLLGASFNVNVAVTSSGASNTWDADFKTGSTTNLVAAGALGAINTKKNTLIVPEITTDVTEIEFDAAGVETFATGVIEVVVYYAVLTSLANV